MIHTLFKPMPISLLTASTPKRPTKFTPQPQTHTRAHTHFSHHVPRAFGGHHQNSPWPIRPTWNPATSINLYTIANQPRYDYFTQSSLRALQLPLKMAPKVVIWCIQKYICLCKFNAYQKHCNNIWSLRKILNVHSTFRKRSEPGRTGYYLRGCLFPDETKFRWLWSGWRATYSKVWCWRILQRKPFQLEGRSR